MYEKGKRFVLDVPNGHAMTIVSYDHTYDLYTYRIDGSSINLITSSDMIDLWYREES